MQEAYKMINEGMKDKKITEEEELQFLAFKSELEFYFGNFDESIQLADLILKKNKGVANQLPTIDAYTWKAICLFFNGKVDVEWWITLLTMFLSVVTLGLSYVILHHFISMVLFNIESEIRSQRLSSSNTTFTFRISEDATAIRAQIEQFDIDYYGITMGLSFTPQFRTPHIRCLTHEETEIENRHHSPVRYRIHLPSNVHPLDPKLRVRWVIRNTDTNDILIHKDEIAQNNLEVEITDFDNKSNFRISCRVYRVMGDEITDFYNGFIFLNLEDRLDRSKPFVRWNHHVFVPNVTVYPDGFRVTYGYHLLYRKSKIHRTDFPLRCTMVSKFSLNKPEGGTPETSQPTKIVYLNSLPFKLEEIDNYRDKLCDYCFYGGPDKDELKSLPNNQ